MSAEKVEKIVVGIMSIMKRMSAFFITIYPADGYDFPMLGSDITESPDHAMIIVDMPAMTDIVVNQAYQVKYFDPIEPLWKDYQFLNNQINPNAWYRAMNCPYPITGRHKFPGGDRAIVGNMVECLCKFTDFYIDNVILLAKPAVSPEAAGYAIARKQAIKDIYTAKDPGLGPLHHVMGAESARKWTDILY